MFLGIPYAQPPLGPLRLTIPQSLNSSFSGTKSATAYFPECVGYGGDDIGYKLSEDCLALNVIRPANYSGQQLPVAVWIHGGGLQMGGTADRRYNLSFIVDNSVQIGKPIIGVSIAYRLGPWGFLFSQEVQGSGNANIGLRDQRLALHWLQENIAAFGGDPTKVTIWGESAGAYSVGAHLVAYGGRDDKIFRAAIMESGNPVNYAPYRDAGFYQPSYDLIVNQTDCHNQTDSLNCLRSVPFAKLNKVFNQTLFTGMTPFEAVIDGDIIQRFGSIQLADTDFVHVPIIDGANSDEGTAFGPVGIENATQFAAYLEGGANPATQAALPAFLVQEVLAAYPDNPSLGIPAELGSERLNATYGKKDLPSRLPSFYCLLPRFLYTVHLLMTSPLFSPTTGFEYRRTSAYAGDEVFIANRRLTCATWAANSVPAYCYRFNARPNGIPPEVGVTHFQEVAFVFNNVQGLGYAVNPFADRGPSYANLSKLMSCSWASFVHDLDPNSFRSSSVGKDIVGQAAPWPTYGNGSQAMNIVWDANVTSFAERDDFRAKGIDLINQNSLLYLR